MRKATDKSKHTKKNIIDQAAYILENEGVKALNINNLVKKCNISKTTFYNYFNSKIELVAALREYKENYLDVITKRDEILDKASQAFFHIGADGIDMDSIAKASGINRASLYRYFPSREKLLEHAVQNELRNRQRNLLSITEVTKDPLKQFEMLLEKSCDPVHQHYDTLMLVTCRYMLYKNKNIIEYFNELINSTIKMIAEIFENGKKEGIFKGELDSNLMAVMLLALSIGIDFNHEHDLINNSNEIKRAALDLISKFIKM